MDVEKIVSENIIGSLKEIDLQEMVMAVISQELNNEIQKEIKVVVKEKIVDFINEQFKNILLDGVKTDDGWGNKKTFTSFKDFVMQEFDKRLKENWEMQRQIEKVVQERLATLIAERKTEITQKIATELLK
jgi:hypothetical protein